MDAIRVVLRAGSSLLFVVASVLRTAGQGLPLEQVSKADVCRMALEKTERLIVDHSLQEAQQSINTALSLEPNFAHAYADRAKLELAQGNAKKAIVDLERARSADPKSRQIAYALARAYQRDGDKAKADRLFREVRGQSDEDAGQFAKDSLTETLAVVSGGPH